MLEKDRVIIRDLAKRVVEVAELPIMAERKEIWKRHHGLERVRLMILVFPENSWRELIPEATLECEEQLARGIERNLRTRLYYHNDIRDDTVIEKTYIVDKAVWHTGWGLEPKFVPSSMNFGAGKYYPVIHSADDLKKLKFPEVVYDEKATQRRLEQLQDLFGDILNVQLKGIRRISFHLMNLYAKLRGLDQVMIDMLENPEMLHEAMKFIEMGHHHIIDQYVDLNLFARLTDAKGLRLSLNNDDTWIYPGGNGYTYELPQPDYDPGWIHPRNMRTPLLRKEVGFGGGSRTYTGVA